MAESKNRFLGQLNGQPVFATSKRHLLTYGLTRSGKGRSLIVPSFVYADRQTETPERKTIKPKKVR